MSRSSQTRSDNSRRDILPRAVGSRCPSSFDFVLSGHLSVTVHCLVVISLGRESVCVREFVREGVCERDSVCVCVRVRVCL